MNKEFSATLLKWYEQNKRNLPFRHTKNPYKIWLSEVIFQQTRISQGLVYYKKFIDRFPSVIELADAERDEVMLLWQGLGYYSRARNLHVAAKIVVDDYNGVFPSNFKTLLLLKGVGQYTAAAISSICYNECVVAIDGNVNRVLARYFAESEPVNGTSGKKRIKHYAENLIDRQKPGDFNQAMMELGALICTPQNPNCSTCPIQVGCIAFSQNEQIKYPVKSKKNNSKQRFFYFIIINEQATTYLQKRGEDDIWGGLFQFPLIETPTRISEEEIITTDFIKNTIINECTVIKISKEIKHVLTHQKIYARFIHVIPEKKREHSGLIRVGWKDLRHYSMPRLITKYLESNNAIQ